jgi:hypothetical protein
MGITSKSLVKVWVMSYEYDDDSNKNNFFGCFVLPISL